MSIHKGEKYTRLKTINFHQFLPWKDHQDLAYFPTHFVIYEPHPCLILKLLVITINLCL